MVRLGQSETPDRLVRLDSDVSDMTIAALVDQAIRAQSVPLIGVTIGDEANRATWIAVHPAGTSDTDKAKAVTVIQTVVVDVAAQTDADAQSLVDNKAIKAAVLTSLWGRLGRQPTAQEISAERTRYVAIYKSL